jgi:isopentenyl-diphosphate delta-isomerase
MEQVILVDANDNAIGTMEKMEAHRKGVLHRAFSVLIYNSKGEMLLQKRAKVKYHSGGLWTNACCSHPQPGEQIENAANRKLKQEMGINLTPSFAYKFIYHAPLDNNLIEHEVDYVLTGLFDGEPRINPEEVEEWKFADLDFIKADASKNPDQYTAWFRLLLTHKELDGITV